MSSPARPWPGAPWQGPDPSSWTSSLDHDAFVAGVGTIREEIAAGDVYQVNLTRRLRAPLPVPAPGLWLKLRSGSRFSDGLHVEEPAALLQGLRDAGARDRFR